MRYWRIEPSACPRIPPPMSLCVAFASLGTAALIGAWAASAHACRLIDEVEIFRVIADANFCCVR
jgi:hypothetical protein